MADSDMRLGPVIEAVIEGQYFWVPFENIRSLHFEAPSDLRDAVWMAATFTWTNDGQSVGLVPTRYAGSETEADALLRLGRKTIWVQRGPEFYVGLGQRMLATNSDDFPVMDVRSVEFDAITDDG
jgi:type VI secretion system protein ImpE